METEVEKFRVTDLDGETFLTTTDLYQARRFAARCWDERLTPHIVIDSAGNQIAKYGWGH